MNTDAGRVNLAGMGIVLVLCGPVAVTGIFQQLINAVFGDHTVSVGPFIGAVVVVAVFTLVCVGLLVFDSRAGRD